MGVGALALIALVAVIALPRPAGAASPGEAAPLRVVSLDEALALALAGSPWLAAGAHDVAAAVAARDGAAAVGAPLVKVVGAATVSRRPQRLFPAASPGEPAVVAHPIFGADLTLAWPLYTGGRVDAAVAGADVGIEEARLAEAWRRRTLVHRVRVAHVRLVAQRALLEALEAAADALVKQVDLAQARVAAGKAEPLARDRLSVRLLAIRQRLSQERAVREAALASFAAALGLDVRAGRLEVRGETPGASSSDLPALEDLTVLIGRALERREDHRLRVARVRRLGATIDVAQAARRPQVWVQGSYGLRWAPFPADAPDGASAIADVGQLAVVADWPLFDGGRAAADEDAGRARRAAAEADVRASELDLGAEVAAAVRGRATASERLAWAETSLGFAREAYRVEVQREAAGRATISEVLSAHADLVEAEASRAAAAADLGVAHADLERAVAGPVEGAAP